MKHFYFLFLLLSTGCLPRGVVTSFTQCYDSQNNHIEKILKTNGFYLGAYSDGKEGHSMMFYNDGTVTTDVYTGNGNTIMSGDWLYKNPLGWGTYIVRGNIIIAQIINKTTYASNCVEERFKIVNDSTLELISVEGLYRKYFRNNNPESYDYVMPLKFIPLVDKPDSASWLKEKKWFWCDEHKYNKYMAKLKSEKRRKKGPR